MATPISTPNERLLRAADILETTYGFRVLGPGERNDGRHFAVRPVLGDDLRAMIYPVAPDSVKRFSLDTRRHLFRGAAQTIVWQLQKEGIVAEVADEVGVWVR